jgi:2-hydroxychromene-2-carboxylate isomerase
MSSPPVVDVYWSFRSPYSYLAAPRLASWKRQYRIELRFRPVLPLLLRRPDFFEKIDPLHLSYFTIDTRRAAEALGLPYQPGNPDPVSLHIDEDGIHRMDKEQPYIYRLTYLGVLAEERGHGIEFAEQVSRLIWSTNDWDKGTFLADATRRAGLNLAELDDALERDRARLEAVVNANQQGLAAAGHWGVPTFVFAGEPFFGQDRMDVLLCRLRQNGLEEVSDADVEDIGVEKKQILRNE